MLKNRFDFYSKIRYLALTVLGFSLPSLLSANVVDCGGTSIDSATCAISSGGANVNISSVPGTGSTSPFSRIEFNNLSGEDLTVQVEEGDAPSRAFVRINNYGANTNTVINARSKRNGVNSAPVVLTGDILGNVTIDTKGKDGDPFSKVCARNFLDGVYGNDKRTAFLDRRGIDNTLPADRCTTEDLDLLDDQMACVPDHVEDPLVSDLNRSVDLNSIKYGYECTAASAATGKQCYTRNLIVEYPVLVAVIGDTNLTGSTTYQASVNTSSGLVKRMRSVGKENPYFPSCGDFGYFATGFRNDCYPSAYRVYDRMLIPTNWFSNLESPTSTQRLSNIKPSDTYAWASRHGSLANGGIEGVISCFGSPARETLSIYGNNFLTSAPGINLCSGFQTIAIISTLYRDYTVGYSDQCIDDSVPYTSSDTIDGSNPRVSAFGGFVFSQHIKFRENDNNCAAEPPLNAQSSGYTYTGYKQSESLGTELISCAPGSCPGVNFSSVSRTAQRDTITPTPPTSPGKIVALIYDGTLTTSSGAGDDGNPSDITVPNKIRYCKRVRDAVTDGIQSAYARNPVVSLDRVEWQSLRPSVNTGSGTIIVPENNVVVLKKVDQSVRFLVEQQQQLFFKN